MSEDLDPFTQRLTDELHAIAESIPAEGVQADAVRARARQVAATRRRTAVGVGIAAGVLLVGGSIVAASQQSAPSPERVQTTSPDEAPTTTTAVDGECDAVRRDVGDDPIDVLDPPAGCGVVEDDPEVADTTASTTTSTAPPATTTSVPPTVPPTAAPTTSSPAELGPPDGGSSIATLVEGQRAWAVYVEVLGAKGPPIDGEDRVGYGEDLMYDVMFDVMEAGAEFKMSPVACDIGGAALVANHPEATNPEVSQLFAFGAYFTTEAAARRFVGEVGRPVAAVGQVRITCVDQPDPETGMRRG